MFEEACLQILFAGFGRKGQEIEVVRVLCDLLCQIGMRRRKCPLEVRKGLPLATEKLALDLEHQNVAAPAMLDRGLRVPQPLVPFLNLLNQRNVVVPGQFCKRRLQNCFIGPSLRTSLHVAEVAGREPLHVRELPSEVVGQSLDDFSSPAVLALARQNLFPDPPIEQHQFLIDGDRGTQLGCSNSCREQLKKIPVTFWVGSEVGHGLFCRTKLRASWRIGEQQKPGGLSCKLLQNQANRQRFFRTKRGVRSAKPKCFFGSILEIIQPGRHRISRLGSAPPGFCCSRSLTGLARASG